jgi:hypothetical protein
VFPRGRRGMRQVVARVPERAVHDDEQPLRFARDSSHATRQHARADPDPAPGDFGRLVLHLGLYGDDTHFFTVDLGVASCS